MLLPILIYDGGAWNLTKEEKSKLQVTEMLFLREILGCTRKDRFQFSKVLLYCILNLRKKLFSR